ncbi:amphi-Trp domain-containing protein [Thermodesulfovibrio sp. N1]|uniref:amphi-Trp domain-containing protein n=1 Tax=Thermodesulfovibrio sp. N1 TaxID=1871110 RepID=UPI0009F41BE0|nr:amphi-Trp domain-containing protein [Thermodesulfovibrio sp. N1]
MKKEELYGRERKRKKVKFEKTVNKAEAADYLRKLADALEKGTVTVVDVNIEIPEDFELEVEYKEKEGKKQIEVEFEWE